MTSAIRTKAEYVGLFLEELAEKIREHSLAEDAWNEKIGEYMKPFLQELAEKIREYSVAEDARNRETAEKFSPFQYIWLNENMSSRIIADLLNPAGTHGQGRFFLDKFLELCELGNDFFSREEEISVECEAMTYSITNSLRRIDILLTCPGHALAIENKIWASDQREQLLDYLHHLKRTTQNVFRLVYLAPAGRSLPEDNLAKFQGTFHVVKWQALLECLRQCKEHVKAKKLRFFLGDFIHAMNKILGSTMEKMEETTCLTQ
jgi:hypothetical protein